MQDFGKVSDVFPLGQNSRWRKRVVRSEDGALRLLPSDLADPSRARLEDGASIRTPISYIRNWRRAE